jgi:hypothetical protein
MEKRKDDSFICFKYAEVKRVIEDKWFIVKEIFDLKEDFMSIKKDIIKKKENEYEVFAKSMKKLAKTGKINDEKELLINKD